MFSCQLSLKLFCKSTQMAEKLQRLIEEGEAKEKTDTENAIQTHTSIITAGNVALFIQ